MYSIKETDLPGIGRKFKILTRRNDQVVIVIHDDGRRELYLYDPSDPEESAAMVTLEDLEARKISGILGGLAYMPKALESVDMAFESLVIDWMKIESDFNCIDFSIHDLGIRQKTGATIIAMIYSKTERSVNPAPDEIFKQGITVVFIGERQQTKNCRKLLQSGRL